MKHSRKSDDYTRKVDRNRPFETPDLLKDHFISRLQILPIQMEISSRERRNLSLFSAHFGTRPNKMTQIFGFRIRVLFPIFPIFRKKMECKQRDVSHGLLYTSMSLFATYFFPQSLKSHVANVASGSVELFRAIKTNFQSKGIESKAMNGLYIYIYFSFDLLSLAFLSIVAYRKICSQRLLLFLRKVTCTLFFFDFNAIYNFKPILPLTLHSQSVNV